MKRVEIIQALRFFGALAVFLGHCNFYILKNGGGYAVELFTIISGYIIVLSTQSEESKKSFLLKRIIRIVPLYWILTVLMFAVVYIWPSLSVTCEPVPTQLVKSMLFIPFLNSRGFDLPILGVGWTLNYEMAFYLLFFVAMLISHRYRAYIAASICILLTLFGVLLRPENFFLQYYTNSFVLEFSIGIFSYYLLKYLTPKLKTINKKWKLVFGLISIVSFVRLVTYDYSNDALPRVIMAGIPAFICFFFAMLAWQEGRIPPALVKLGNMTYSFYLIELFTAKAYVLLTAGMSMLAKTGIVLVFLGITLICSWVSYELFEIRLTNFLKSKLIHRDGVRNAG